MKYSIQIVLLIFLSYACKSIDGILPKDVNCNNGMMKQAFCESGKDFPGTGFEGLPEDFIIWVDTSNYATNFISFMENLNRNFSIDLDTSEILFLLNIKGWRNLSSEQKFERVEQEKLNMRYLADSIHIANNRNKQQIYIINNSKDTVSIQMQDWDFMCILQAKAYNDIWYPIQYWQFSGCGNSYYLKHFPPKIANSFVARLPKDGDFETTLRYKLLGKNKFYYSNEFPGKINYCEFIADSSVLPSYPENNFLDSLFSYWDY
jgi:hypothetical protein